MKKQIIQVSNNIIATGYDSLSAAISVSTRIRDSKKDLCKLINKKVIVGYQFNGASLVLEAKDNIGLVVSMGKNAVEWDVVSHVPNIEKAKRDINNVVFEFSDGERFFWNWKEILDEFIGKQIIVSPSDQYLFIFIRDNKDYMIDYLVDINDPRNQFLFISEE
ncbi:MAG: hypothetical protein GY784_16230 [Gammaproteobacteria bacterium]|nr:hypothetical protein [Gammaproteobacteria bacterium]